MTKQSKVILISVMAIIILSGVVYWLFFYKPKATTTNTSTTNNTGTGTSTSNNFPLKIGSKGSNVLRLQKAINRFKYRTPNGVYYMVAPPPVTIAEDGIFGQETLNRYDALTKPASLLFVTSADYPVKLSDIEKLEIATV